MPKVATMVDEKKFFLVKPVECWKTPSWERNVSEHNLVQHTQIAIKECFYFLHTQSILFLSNRKTIHCFFLWEIQIDWENGM